MFKPRRDDAAAALPADAVAQARTRARQRLIGAVVLLGIGIVGFPLVFENQPRPIPVDIPIEIPKKDALPPLVAPPAPTAPASVATASTSGRTAARTAPASAPDAVITESQADAGREVTAPATGAPRVTAAPAPRAAVTASRSDDGERARALLEGRGGAAAATPSGQRYVVQVGAFADAASAREARQRVEKLGLKTYTQVAETPAGSRVRVRVGPFASRSEADAALAKAKAGGLAAVVLTL